MQNEQRGTAAATGPALTLVSAGSAPLPSFDRLMGQENGKLEAIDEEIFGLR